MTVINWNPYVNKELSIEGNTSYDENYVQSLRFNSGKERLYLKNNFVPKIYSLSIELDSQRIVTTGKYNTEYMQFIYWYEYGLRYGILPFYFPRIQSPGETGIYQFIPGSLQYSDTRAIVTATFSLQEIG
ncbi:MAG: hypothetical protein LBB98_12085 [Treponema sp.]|jgi:hypothetical protein|nr:hypothetical protein [Treponema sp.]